MWGLLLLAGVDATVLSQTPNGSPSLMKLRGGAEQYKTGKVWVTSSFTRDHVRLAWE